MTTPLVTKHEILAAMEIYGGSFIRALVELYNRADEENRDILEHAFADYFDVYRKIAIHRLSQPLDRT